MVNHTKILIAGGNGFIGSYLKSHFIQKMNVVSIDFDNNSTNKNRINLDLTNNIEIIQFAKVTDQFDVLIFLVGLAHAKGKGKDLSQFMQINYQTLVNLLSALEKNNKVPEKIIFASTISVYGEQYQLSIYDEDSEQNPFSPYAVSKLQAEQYLLDNFSAKSRILRFAPVYSSKFLLNINRRTNMGSRFYRVGKGNSKLSLCNIQNIATVIEAIINDKVPEGIYNLSDLKEYTYDELLRWKNANWILPIPAFVVKMLYYFGELINSTFLKENTVKLISDNIFPADKIRKYIDLPASLTDIHLND